MNLPEDCAYDPSVYRQISQNIALTFSSCGNGDIPLAIETLVKRYGEGVRVYAKRYAIDLERAQRPGKLAALKKEIERDFPEWFVMLDKQVKLWEELEKVQSLFGEDQCLIATAMKEIYSAAASVIDRIVWKMDYPANPVCWYDNAPIQEFSLMFSSVRGSLLERRLKNLRLGIKHQSADDPAYVQDLICHFLVDMPKEDDPLQRDMYLSLDESG